MPRAPGLAEQFDQPEAEAVPIDVVEVVAPPDEVAELRATVATMALRIKELEQPKPEETWPALKVAAFDTGMIGETLRAWCANGWVTARREGKHWFVEENSVKARQLRIGWRK